MKYLFLVYGDGSQGDGSQWERMSKSERDIYERACSDNDEALRESGYLAATTDLHSVTTVWIQDGQVSLIDGSLAGAKEEIAGLFFIHARDLNEAIQVAAKMPQAQKGPVEIRPILELTRVDPME